MPNMGESEPRASHFSPFKNFSSKNSSNHFLQLTTVYRDIRTIYFCVMLLKPPLLCECTFFSLSEIRFYVNRSGSSTMKLHHSLLLAASTTAFGGVTSMDINSHGARQKLLQQARQVEGYEYGEGRRGAGSKDEQDNWWLADYSIKMISCMAGESFVNYEQGNLESSTVIFRLCPYNTCMNNHTLGCVDGYADYAVGINTFAEAFAESVRDNYQYYTVNQMKDYIRECRQLDGGHNDNKDNSGYSMYIGPACSADGKNIRLATFSDQVSDRQAMNYPFSKRFATIFTVSSRSHCQ
jgi:hypothetical protein